MQNLEVTVTPKIEVRPAAFQDNVRSFQKTIPLTAPPYRRSRLSTFEQQMLLGINAKQFPIQLYYVISFRGST